MLKELAIDVKTVGVYDHESRSSLSMGYRVNNVSPTTYLTNKNSMSYNECKYNIMT